MKNKRFTVFSFILIAVMSSYLYSCGREPEKPQQPKQENTSSSDQSHANTSQTNSSQPSNSSQPQANLPPVLPKDNKASESLNIIETDTVDFTGTMNKNITTKALEFDLSFDFLSSSYKISGSTTVHGKDNVYAGQEWMDFGQVKVKKIINTQNGKTSELDLDNSGHLVYIKAGLRMVAYDKMVLAQVPIAGKFETGQTDSGLWLSSLTVNDKASKRCINYGSWSGHFELNQSNVSYGDIFLLSPNSYDNTTTIFDVDGSEKTPTSTTVTFNFGGWHINGIINFSSIGTNTRVFTVKCTIKKTDNEGFVFSALPKREFSKDDKKLQSLISFFELFLTYLDGDPANDRPKL
ncbi:MAG: hypothetical protein HY072_08455 [Deltaproteobacteria bacterium]|nr:hypothetical protein [Deltaproteobacteria bacterium]